MNIINLLKKSDKLHLEVKLLLTEAQFCLIEATNTSYARFDEIIDLIEDLQKSEMAIIDTAMIMKVDNEPLQ